MALITGNTFAVKEQLKAAFGAKWNAAQKGWEVSAEQVSQAQAVVEGKIAFVEGAFVELQVNQHGRKACPCCFRYDSLDKAIVHGRSCPAANLQIQAELPEAPEAAPQQEAITHLWVKRTERTLVSEDRYDRDFKDFKAGLKSASDCQNTDY